MRPTHILDTSALLAHYFDEPGAEEVVDIWSDRSSRPAVCVLTLPELRTRLAGVLEDSGEEDRVYRLYADELTSSIAVTRQIAEAAMDLRRSAKRRLPLVDSVVAACAKCESAVLVHRDPHMAAIPSSLVPQIVLPPKA